MSEEWLWSVPLKNTDLDLITRNNVPPDNSNYYARSLLTMVRQSLGFIFIPLFIPSFILSFILSFPLLRFPPFHSLSPFLLFCHFLFWIFSFFLSFFPSLFSCLFPSHFHPLFHSLCPHSHVNKQYLIHIRCWIVVMTWHPLCVLELLALYPVYWTDLKVTYNPSNCDWSVEIVWNGVKWRCSLSLIPKYYPHLNHYDAMWSFCSLYYHWCLTPSILISPSILLHFLLWLLWHNTSLQHNTCEVTKCSPHLFNLLFISRKRAWKSNRNVHKHSEPRTRIFWRQKWKWKWKCFENFITKITEIKNANQTKQSHS